MVLSSGYVLIPELMLALRVEALRSAYVALRGIDVRTSLRNYTATICTVLTWLRDGTTLTTIVIVSVSVLAVLSWSAYSLAMDVTITTVIIADVVVLLPVCCGYGRYVNMEEEVSRVVFRSMCTVDSTRGTVPCM